MKQLCSKLFRFLSVSLGRGWTWGLLQAQPHPTSSLGAASKVTVPSICDNARVAKSTTWEWGWGLGEEMDRSHKHRSGGG